jgi:hypothetical protein
MWGAIPVCVPAQPPIIGQTIVLPFAAFSLSRMSVYGLCAKRTYFSWHSWLCTVKCTLIGFNLPPCEEREKEKNFRVSDKNGLKAEGGRGGHLTFSVQFGRFFVMF